jgi:integrase/recombinase XerD
MATMIPSAVLIPVAPVFSSTERLALGGFLAGYSGQTRQAYELDLRQFASWYQQHQLHLFAAGRAPSPGFYRYAVEEEHLDHSPAAHVRRPRLDYESHATGLDRNELGALLVVRGLGPPAEHALISLLVPTSLQLLRVIPAAPDDGAGTRNAAVLSRRSSGGSSIVFHARMVVLHKVISRSAWCVATSDRDC